MNSLYIITGGPGAGKTTLLHELAQSGYTTVPEDARTIIQHQLATGGDALPWKNKKLYAELMLQASYKTYQRIIQQNINGPVFFDRGISDTLCYMKMEGIPVTDNIIAIVRECIYNPKVFILPPWPEIYQTDNERKQNPDEAERTFHFMKKTYQDYGYTIIEVPKESVQMRKEFILHSIR